MRLIRLLCSLLPAAMKHVFHREVRSTGQFDERPPIRYLGDPKKIYLS